MNNLSSYQWLHSHGAHMTPLYWWRRLRYIAVELNRRRDLLLFAYLYILSLPWSTYIASVWKIVHLKQCLKFKEVFMKNSWNSIPSWHTSPENLSAALREYAKRFSCVAGIVLCMGSANERRRYNVTSSLIGWAQTQIDPWCWNSTLRAPLSQFISNWWLSRWGLNQMAAIFSNDIFKFIF